MTPKPTTETRERAPSDLELDVMRYCLKKLDALEPARRLRVIGWLEDRAREELPAPAKEAPPS